MLRQSDSLFLAESTHLTENERSKYQMMIHLESGKYSADEEMLVSSLQILSQLLYKHYGQNTIILIDEYDVPLDKAFQHGYYREMVTLIRGLFGNALKTNSFLQFAVMTGCLRISKESIFTGLNNFKVYAANDLRYDEAFGFTNEEVKQLLADYYLEKHFAEVKEWYDGYHFGNADIYCPWDVINYVDDLVFDPKARPKAYWINSSGNDLVKRFIDKADMTTRDEIEELIAGHAVKKRIRMDLTYDEVDNTIDNVWSVLFTTGYLTREGREMDGIYRLIIPNKEVREVFVLQIREWFQEKSSEDIKKLDKLCMAFPDGDAETIEDLFNDYLWNTISIRDTAVKGRKENFYHGVLLGLLSHMENWAVWSNIESGEGYCDILLEVPENRVGVVIEMKYAQEDRMEAACTEALEQIEQRQYAARLKSDGMKNIVNYGIACYRKHCKVKIGKENS